MFIIKTETNHAATANVGLDVHMDDPAIDVAGMATATDMMGKFLFRWRDFNFFNSMYAVDENEDDMAPIDPNPAVAVQSAAAADASIEVQNHSKFQFICVKQFFHW